MINEQERLMLDIVNDMAPVLDNSQVQKLRRVLAIRLEPLRIEKRESNIVQYRGNNTELVKWFLLTKRSEGCSQRTIAYYRDTLELVANEVKKPIESLNAMEIRVYLAMVAERSSEVNSDNYRRVISSFFTWLVDNDIITKNPMRQIKKVKFQKKQVLPFTAEEVERLRYGAKDIRLRSMIEFLLSTGCRVAEVVALNQSAIDWKREEVEVLGKGNKKRVVFLNDAAILYLKEYLKTRNDNNPALYVTKEKPYKRLQISGFEILIRKLGREVGVRNVHPHRFRHTVATWAAKRGMSVQLIQKMLGHENIQTTLIYATADLEEVRAAHKKFCV